MAKQKKEVTVEAVVDPNLPDQAQAKLRKLIIKNYCCIGSEGVEIDLDQIVVLVGPNNVGKSTILKAYQKITGEAKPKLTIDDFPGGKIDAANLPTMELHTAFPGHKAADRWVDTSSGENIVRERWTWTNVDVAAQRQGYDVTDKKWADEKPWGFDGVANAKRPSPQRIEAFASPETQAEQVVSLLLKAIKDQTKAIPKTATSVEGVETKTAYGELVEKLGAIQRTIVTETKQKIDDAEKELSNFVGQIFQGYRVQFDAKPEEDLDSAFSFFKAGARLQMGPTGGYLSSISSQGSGARRTLLWAALRYIAEHGKDADPNRPNLLLLDEPELCLHPNAIREACNTLYALADAGKWQVMLTTHSPAFIDLSRDNTTVVRVERTAEGKIHGTTVFRPQTVKLSTDEKEELKLLNLFDPYVAEFFFGGQTILVEGDTEFTALKYATTSLGPDRIKNLHIVRARGKVTIALLAKILNHFNAPYSVLHDADSPTAMRDGKEIANPAWTNNGKILAEVRASKDVSRIRLCASIPDFEGAVFGTISNKEKPYTALVTLRANPEMVETTNKLLQALIDFPAPLPNGFMQWNDIDALKTTVLGTKAKE